ncbi:MAG TPA: ABC transporter ATP-binding protein [Nitrospiria bacterium]|jgi:ATP-binding cassette subfamily B protein/subfamily B ATP-binding cassette protein MsbA|nr:ABC transporter ATP-binding protein [Nitrospiria bacterium]
MRSLFRVVRYIKPYQRLAYLTLACAVLTTTLEMVPPWLLKRVIDDVIRGDNLPLLQWLILGLVAVHLGRNLLNSARIRFNNTLEQRVIYDMRDQIYRALQRLSVSYYENRATGEIMSRVVNDVNNLERIFIDGVEALVMAGLTLLGIMAVLFYLNWRLALIALIPIPFLVLGATVFTTRVHKLYHLIRQQAAQLNALLQDSISGIRETMSFNREAYEVERFNRQSLEYSRGNLRVARIWSVYSPGMILVASTGTLLILWFGTHAVLEGRMTVGGLVAFLSYLGLFYTPINQIHSVNHMLQQSLASGERVFEIMDAVPEVSDRSGAVRPPRKAEGFVEFKNVSFHYRPNAPVLQQISLQAFPGEKIALVGPSGSGKSTIIKLLMRLYDVDTGAIMIDGRDVRDLQLSYLRDQIGVVAQEPFLFNGTVRENIVYGRLDATEEEVTAAAEAARAHEFILSLPDGYATWIGERGVKLSVGQKQRIAIARALLKDPPIIIFDEATSNIDTETEAKIQEALGALTYHRTTFIIAHRLSTLKHVNKILVVQNGRIIERGTHEELLAGGGLYTLLYDAQFQM